MTPIRIAVTGRSGQVATSLQAVAADHGAELVCLGRPDFDLAKPETIAASLIKARADCIISAAAYTAVDKAESERDLAFTINGTGAGLVAEAAASLGVPILHLSTDYVFDGRKPDPYREDDAPNPTSVYGASKLDGEMRIISATPNHAIFRTAWVYSPHGTNFLKTMLRLGETRSEISVVADQVGCPTAAEDIAVGLLEAARQLVESSSDQLRGIFHLTGSGHANWADFAEEIFGCAEVHGRNPVTVKRITSREYPSPVERPANSRLLGDKLKVGYGIELPDWRVSTARAVAALLG